MRSFACFGRCRITSASGGSRARPMAGSTSDTRLIQRSCIGVSASPMPAAVPASISAISLPRSEEHTSELLSPDHLVCRLLLEKKKTNTERNENRNYRKITIGDPAHYDTD